MKVENSLIGGFLYHFKELRSSMIRVMLGIFIGTLIGFVYFNEIVTLLLAPFEKVPSLLKGNSLFASSILDGFNLKIKISFISGLIISSPFSIYHTLHFIFPGLYPKEKKILLILLMLSMILIILATYLLYYHIIPFSISFLTTNQFFPNKVGILLNYRENILYLIQFFFLSLIIFQLPLIVNLLLMLNVISRQSLIKKSKYIIVGIFILSALVTPPDILSLILVAIPLCLLFFVIILIAKIFNFGY